ncbi:hypothetical protein O3G_MSEX007513 [Manduca sexta]|uniref:SAM domain-containing protein n=1 Tax=Manduca sexta TaxID=7130 RepID=A0A921Z6B9_MANSE|nr:hypothetical protein O3G_MSEX007513 [Manduca sexta]KAG6452161.1 hypothetical protein O3G_MSEX007513 [Manduca sexta]
MERCSYGFYTKRSEILDNAQKKKDQEKEPQGSSYQQQISKPDKQLHSSELQSVNVPVTQHVPAQQLLSPSHSSNQSAQSKDDSKDKTIKVANSTTITLIENGNLNSDKDKDNNYHKNYFTLEPKIDKKDECNKNSITITKTIPKQSPGNNQADKSKTQIKPAKRPLQYLETLAEKAGITFEDKYEAANTLLALDKQNNANRRPPELKQPKSEPENHNQNDEFRYRNQKEEDDKLQIQQQIIQQQQQQQLQQLQQQQQLQHLQQQQLQQFQQQALQRQHQHLQQHIKNQQEELLQKQFQQQQQQQQQQKSELLQVAQQPEQQQKFLQPVHTQQFNVPGIGEINLSFLASPQSNVNLLFDKNQKAGMSGEIKQQQIVDGQSQVVQQMSMAQHEASQQHHQTVTVVSSMPSNMAPHQQTGGGIQQQANAGISTMPPLQSLPSNTQHPQQISAEWGHSRVQVIQQPLPNNAYLQQLYNAQGPLIMPGNIALHPSINSQQIQVIAAGKPFQGNQLAPHMLTTQGKQVLQGQAAPFPGYTTIPAIPTTQNQTFVFSPLGVINSQPSILPAHSQPTVSGINQQQKQNDLHKCGGKVSGGKAGGAQTVPVAAQCVQVSQPVLGAQQPAQAQIISPLQAGGQPMQFAPWQISGALPQVWAGGLQAGTLPAGGLIAPNPIFIRGTQPDAPPSMFIQHSPQNNIQHNNASVACATASTTKPRASSDGMTKAQRPLSNILPSGGIRPASSVSTQTNANQSQGQTKHRGKPGVRSPAPASKQDAANQTNKMQHQLQQPKQQLLVMNSSGQMTQITSVQEKQPINKSIQQQAIMQQQAMQQQQQQAQQQQQQAQQQQQQQQQAQQQLIHQQQTQQMVQHYQQGMSLGMQQGTLPVGSVAQTLPMTGLPQTISMVQQIHPISAMGQAGTLVGQINTNQAQQNAPLTQVQTLQPQTQTLVGSGLVQTSVGMAVQQQANLSHTTPMQTVSANNLSSPQLTLQAAQGTVGLLAAPVQGSVLPLQPPATLVAHVKTEDDKSQLAAQAPLVQQIAPQQIVSAESTTEAASTTTVFSSAPAVSSVTTVSTADASISTSTSSVGPTPTSESSKSSSSKEESAPAESASTPATASTAPVPSSAQQTTPLAPQVVTTVASSTSSSSTMTAAITAPVSSGTSTSLFKSTQCTPRNISQPTVHDKGLPKAMVKPNILTHVIEGYVIQEAGEPFAVSKPVTANRPLREWAADKEQDKENKLPSTDEPPRKKQMLEGGASLARISSSNDSAVENTTTISAKDSAPTPMEVADSAPAASEATPQPKIPNANKWSVAEVCDFIRNIPGCAGYADEFLMQEVDGEALLLIRPEHLVMALSMKLGPALKIVACIDSLRPESEQTTHEHD